MEPPYKLFTSLEQIKRIDSRRVIYLFIFAISFLVTEFGRHVYRPIIYRNDIQDFGLADSIGNLGGIVVQVFFGLALVNPNHRQGYRIIGFLTMGYIIYEIVQPILPKGTFDFKDVVGTFIGGVCAALIFFLIHKKYKNNRVLVNL
jgi:glycopeptide antibiotics resistance protein